jgi:hypothetical protein
MGEMRNSYEILVGKSEGKKLLGRARRRWEDYIKTDFRAIRWEGWTAFIWLRIGIL